MKINDLYSSSQAAAAYQNQTQRSQQAEAALNTSSSRAGGPSSAAGTDAVDLSNLAGTLQSALTDSPDHLARLDRLAELFASGQYQANPHQVASALVDETVLSSRQ